MKKRIILAAVVACAAMPPAVLAQTDHAGHHDSATQVAQAASAQFAEGEIRRVDKEAKKLTIKHGPIQNLDMPPMTMVFQVRDPAMLDQVKAGDRVKFQAEQAAGQYIVTKIEK